MKVTKQAAAALTHAHMHEVVHRDIKPQNILITEDGSVKVTHFGIASDMASSSIFRQTGVMGTPHYMSLEQLQGDTIDDRADVYFREIVLYELLTGSALFDGGGMGEIFRKHQEEPVPSVLTELVVPEWLDPVVRRALEKEPSCRFDSVGDMLTALDQEL